MSPRTLIAIVAKKKQENGFGCATHFLLAVDFPPGRKFGLMGPTFNYSSTSSLPTNPTKGLSSLRCGVQDPAHLDRRDAPKQPPDRP